MSSIEGGVVTALPAATTSVVEALTAVVAALADGDVGARMPNVDADDDLLPLIAQVNALASQLDVNSRQMEQRMQARTTELEQLNSDVMRLSEFGNLLQACQSSDEAFDVIAPAVDLLFPGLAGALFLFNSSRNLLELKASWGGLHVDPSVPREHCWALRRGQQHLVMGKSPRLSCKHTVERWGDSICYPMSAQGETLGMLHLMGRSLQLPGQTLLTPGKQRLGITMAEQTALSLANLRMRDSLGQQALLDPLTGLYNRRFADETVAREIVRAQRRGTSIGIIMADLDNFKRYNDVHGHDAGDVILSAVASAVRGTIHGEDMACRYGGEELLILLPDADSVGLRAKAEEIRAAVASTSVVHLGSPLPPVTLSVGAAMFPDDAPDFVEALRLADAALYDAKQAGRNRTVVAAAPA